LCNVFLDEQEVLDGLIVMKKINLEKVFKPRRLGSAPILDVLKKSEIHMYIAGPISFVEELQDYRKTIKEGLEKISPKFKIHDPWEREKVTMGDIKSSIDMAAIEERKSIAEEVITADLKDISSCDMVIAYLFRIGMGTSMEIFFMSRILNKPVIVVYTPTEETHNGLPLWLYGHANMVFQSKKGMYSFLRKGLEEIEGKKHEKKA
jgi:nucleoside 2-deoxyribosyltransferase